MGAAQAGGSDTSDERKQDTYSSQFKKNYKITDDGKPKKKNLLDKLEDRNRKFYEEKVKPAGKSKAPNYETYMKDRLAGKTDAYGNINPNFGKDSGGNNNNQTIVKKNVGGTEIQTTQEKLDEEKTKDDEYDVRKVKKKGRKEYTLTSSKGVTQVSDDYSLGKKSLLGNV